MCLDMMKKILDLGEFKLGRKTEDFKFFKREVMNCFYNSLKKTFNTLKKEGLVLSCKCKSNLRQGYSNCEFCGGLGFIFIDKKDK